MTLILLLESKRNNGVSFAAPLRERYTLLVANTGKAALRLAAQQKPDVLVLDAASLRTSGDRLCRVLHEGMMGTPIIHIKEAGSPKSGSVADTVLYLPFTYRKLCNRIERHLQAERGEILNAGPFRLNVEQALLITPQGEKKLTPKLTKLMEVFMRYPDQLVDRRTLMREVWQTDYMGDTRTLDVHIRWIRQAVEENPNKPAYIRTVRGKGYILKLKA